MTTFSEPQLPVRRLLGDRPLVLPDAPQAGSRDSVSYSPIRPFGRGVEDDICSPMGRGSLEAGARAQDRRISYPNTPGNTKGRDTPKGTRPDRR